MRDNRITNFSLKEEKSKNQFTRKGDFALIRKTTDRFLGDAELKSNLKTYAQILKISDDKESLENLSSMSNGKYQVVETKKLMAF